MKPGLSRSFQDVIKHLLKREGLLKISTSSRISIPVTCAQCSQRFCERRCLLYPSRQLVSLAVCCHHCKLGVIHPDQIWATGKHGKREQRKRKAGTEMGVVSH